MTNTMREDTIPDYENNMVLEREKLLRSKLDSTDNDHADSLIRTKGVYRLSVDRHIPRRKMTFIVNLRTFEYQASPLSIHAIMPMLNVAENRERAMNPMNDIVKYQLSVKIDCNTNVKFPVPAPDGQCIDYICMSLKDIADSVSRPCSGEAEPTIVIVMYVIVHVISSLYSYEDKRYVDISYEILPGEKSPILNPCEIDKLALLGKIDTIMNRDDILTLLNNDLDAY